jgi:Helix-turn-helix domain
MELQFDKYLNEKEVSELTGLALPTLRGYRFKKIGIPYSKIGKSVRYCLKDVVSFMEANKIETDTFISTDRV